jgi:hypothetical protein
MSGIASLEQSDYEILGLDYHSFITTVSRFSGRDRWWIEDTTHILALVGWLQRVLDAERLDSQRVRWEHSIRIDQKLPEEVFDHALWVQFYLLLTCADTLGHLEPRTNVVRERFMAFWRDALEIVKQDLQNSFLAWRIDDAEVQPPSADTVRSQVQSMAPGEQWSHLCDFLYAVRNGLVHEGSPPDLGWHPVLAQLQGVRLSMPSLGVLPPLVHLDAHSKDRRCHYFCVIDASDPVATLRVAVLQGLRNILGRGGTACCDSTR